MSPYAAAKLAGEYYCQAFFHSYGLQTVGLRYFNVFGPRQDPDSPYSAVIPLFISAMLQGQRPTVFGDGLQTRDFAYVENVVHGNLLAADADGVEGKVGPHLDRHFPAWCRRLHDDDSGCPGRARQSDRHQADRAATGHYHVTAGQKAASRDR